MACWWLEGGFGWFCLGFAHGALRPEYRQLRHFRQNSLMTRVWVRRRTRSDTPCWVASKAGGLGQAVKTNRQIGCVPIPELEGGCGGGGGAEDVSPGSQVSRGLELAGQDRRRHAAKRHGAVGSGPVGEHGLSAKGFRHSVKAQGKIRRVGIGEFQQQRVGRDVVGEE